MRDAGHKGLACRAQAEQFSAKSNCHQIAKCISHRALSNSDSLAHAGPRCQLQEMAAVPHLGPG